jgi:hypothetical protein
VEARLKRVGNACQDVVQNSLINFRNWRGIRPKLAQFQDHLKRCSERKYPGVRTLSRRNYLPDLFLMVHRTAHKQLD